MTPITQRARDEYAAHQVDLPDTAPDTRPAWRRADWATAFKLTLCWALPLTALAILVWAELPA